MNLPEFFLYFPNLFNENLSVDFALSAKATDRFSQTLTCFMHFKCFWYEYTTPNTPLCKWTDNLTFH